MTERVLVVHNFYKYRGGEDSVVESEINLLRSHGHPVEVYFRRNDDIDEMAPLLLARQTLWSSRTTHDLAQLIGNFRPDVIHSHNTFPLVSPSLYWTAERFGVPVVQTLHNFRLMCVNALFLREGNVCEKCMGRFPWPGIVHACYRGSRPASVAVAGMLALHRAIGTFRDRVTRYIALNEFSRKKFIEGGLPEDRIVVKPNFVDLPHPSDEDRSGILFVGRLSTEKGVAVLAHAAALQSAVQIRVAGVGPDAALLKGIRGVTQLGHVTSEIVREEMNKSVALTVPSICYENFPRTIVEAFACALPVIASRIGGLPDIVEEGKTGLLFEPGNSEDLANKMRWAVTHPQEMAAMGLEARLRYESRYTAERNYEQLLTVYRSAIDDIKKLAHEPTG
jgi:glycosyltransferase involved in cell wall biosynthesis